MEDVVAAVRAVHVHRRVPAGPGPHPVVRGHRADAGRPRRRPHPVGVLVLLVVPVVRHHENVQDARPAVPGPAVDHVRRHVRRRVRVHRALRARDQQQEQATDPRRHDGTRSRWRGVLKTKY